MYEILSSNGDFVRKFDNKSQVTKAMFFLGKSDLLFALACDFPGLYRMPLAYVSAVRKELKRLGFQVERGKLNNPVYTYKIFYFGQKPHPMYFGVPKYLANAFKVYFYGFPERDAETALKEVK